MKSTNKVLVFLGLLILVVLGFASCSSESTIPTARHAQPIHAETHWN